jgi:translation initiation factor eIF-2B subunit delta
MVIQLGLRLFDRRIVGSTSRCIALLRTLKVLITDYVTPAGKRLSEALLSTINPNINFLVKCRPLCDSMSNAIKAIKRVISESDPSKPDDEIKTDICDFIDKFTRERILLAQLAIADQACTENTIKDGDVVLTQSSSQLMTSIIDAAFKQGKKFRVIVVDSRPLARGGDLLKHCSKLGIQCSYTLITAVSYVMREASKVFLPAHALLANGYVMGRIGAAVIAMTAKANNVPVLVPCETYKFSDRVQTDAFVFNELGDPNDLLTTDSDPSLAEWQDIDSLKLLNLGYDVTPPEFVDMVITEIGMIPCTSVPVVLRVNTSADRE